jgi:flagellar P-ring protein precursor FlgI
VVDALNQALGPGLASIRDAKSVSLRTGGDPQETYRLIARAESVTLHPDAAARVVVNERSGTVVAGGGVQISSVVVSQGDVRVSVKVENNASQPLIAGGVAPNARSLVVSNTKLSVSEPNDAVATFPNTTVSDLVLGLQKVNVRTREMIAILQAMRAAGALHAEIVVQ